MSEKATKKVVRTTKEEFIADIEEEKKAAEIQPIAPKLEVKPIELPQNAIEEIDLELELKRLISNNELELAKEILQEICDTPIQKAITFLNNLPEGSQATIFVERQPDGLNQKQFIVPCDVPVKLPNYVWYAATQDESDLYSRIVSDYGGGNYRFEIRYNKGFTGLFWKDTLADSPEWLSAKKQEFLDAEKEAEQSELERLRLEVERLKTQTVNNSNSAETSALMVKLAEIEGQNKLAQAEMNHKFELERVKQENERKLRDSQLTDSPIALLQIASKSNNAELVQVAKDLIFDQKKTFWDHAFETLDNPDRAKAIVEVGGGLLGSALSWLIPSKPADNATNGVTSAQQTTKQKSMVEQYKARRNKAKPESEKKEVKDNG